MCKVVSKLPFAYASDKGEHNDHDPHSINPVLVATLRRFAVYARMASKPFRKIFSPTQILIW